ncbi:DUF4183 domain-containing protein [Lysinibacillus sp. NPDC096418]|uniref:DUF4183 domain-containing protein n=1 Tax=Lysinibacillus sp. NPDC096418 TaxID=3364138 RepID=UPI00382E25C0
MKKEELVDTSTGKEEEGRMEFYKKRKKVVQRVLLNDCENSNMSNLRIKVSSASIDYSPKNVTEITILPTVNRYFHIADANLNLTNGATFTANLFFNDYGNNITEFMIFSPNGYVNLYINGMMQESGVYNITTNTLTFIPQNATIYKNTPIIIESLGFTAKLNL